MLTNGRPTAAALLLILVAFPGPISRAQPAAPAPPPPAAAPVPAPSQNSQFVNELITRLVLDNLPHEFETKKNWGRTTTIWSGVSVWREGLRLKTRGRESQVNHGQWELYRVRLVNPEQQFRLGLENLREAAPGRAAFDAWAEAQLAAYAQLVEWQHGIQLISVSADADAKVRLRVSCDVGLQLDPTKLPPDVVLDPVVRQANLELVDFQLRRISDFHGPVVKELGRLLRKILEDKLDEQRPRIVEQMNREIDKHRPRLRLSVHDVLASRFADMAAKQLPGVQPQQ